MDTKELERIAEKLEKLEHKEYKDSGLYMHNGGFVEIEYHDYDEEYIYVEIKSGVQGGADDDYVRYENNKLDRKTLEFIN